jgi:hypothetical protein
LPEKGGRVMKIEAKQLQFLAVPPWFSRRRLRFMGNTNTMQLLETALVIEGYQKTIGYPVIDFLFQWAMCEWTTVTVPYSRIVQCRYSRRWLARAIFFAIIDLPILILVGISLVLFARNLDFVGAAIPIVLLVALLAMSLWFMLRFLPARYSLAFRRADGNRALTNFRIKSREMQQSFEQKLESNRKAALTA